MKLSKQEICTIPNFLTMFRIFMVPVFIYCYMNMESYIAAIMIMISGFSDFLDGYIARKTNVVTELGKKLDPIADKLLQLAIISCLCFRVDYMIWVFLLFMIKEGAMLICYLYMKAKNGYMDGAMWFGKISTAVFYVTTFALIVLPIQNTIYSSILMIITAIFLAFSFILYMRTYVAMFKTF